MEDVSLVIKRCYIYFLGSREWQSQQMRFLLLSFVCLFFQGRWVLVNETGSSSSGFSDALPSSTLSVPVCMRQKWTALAVAVWFSDQPSEAFCSIQYAQILVSSPACKVSRRFQALFTGKDLNMSWIRCLAFSSTLPHTCPFWQLSTLSLKNDLIAKTLVVDTALIKINK